MKELHIAINHTNFKDNSTDEILKDLLVAIINGEKDIEVDKTPKNMAELKRITNGDIYIYHANGYERFKFIKMEEFIKDKNLIKIKVTSKAYKVITELYEKGYNLKTLKIFFSIKNKYAQLFYDYFELWKENNNFKKKIELTKLRKIFLLENKYSDYKDMRKNVLEPVIEHLNKLDSFDFRDISSSEEKFGNKVRYIKFKNQLVSIKKKEIEFDVNGFCKINTI
ncbi:replication initiation protein, partial [Clostridioides difficile]